MSPLAAFRKHSKHLPKHLSDDSTYYGRSLEAFPKHLEGFLNIGVANVFVGWFWKVPYTLHASHVDVAQSRFFGALLHWFQKRYRMWRVDNNARAFLGVDLEVSICTPNSLIVANIACAQFEGVAERSICTSYLLQCFIRSLHLLALVYKVFLYL